MTRFGNRLRELREGARLTQRELAERAGVDESYIGHLESGRRGLPSLTVLDTLSRALDYPLDLLLRDIGVRLPDRGELEDWQEEVLRALEALSPEERALQIEQIRLLAAARREQHRSVAGGRGQSK